ncbi:MAG TPA: J domain-containing protein [Candidatus Limnocylindria bacterium]
MSGAERFDPYRVLGVRRDASPVELARAYRQQAKRVHPDLHGPDVSRQMRDLNRSWQILSDPDRRRAWDASHPPRPPDGHWPAGARRPATPVSAEPAVQPAWDDARRGSPSGPDRVRVVEGWPRRPEPPPVPAGLRDSGWLAAAVAGGLVVALIVLGWVASTRPAAGSPGDAFATAGVTPAVSVGVDPAHVLAVYRAGDGRLGVASARLGEQGWQARVLEERPDGGEISVRLASDDSGGAWRSVVYGRAPADAERVRLSVASAGGEVSDGLWVIGVRSPLRAEQVLWRFEAADGSVLLSGSGELH